MTHTRSDDTGDFGWPAPRLLLLVTAAIVAAVGAFRHLVEPFFMAVAVDDTVAALPIAHALGIQLLLASIPAFYACGLWQLAEGLGDVRDRTRLGDLRAGFSSIAYGALSSLLIVPTIIGWIEYRGGIRFDFDPGTFALLAGAFTMQRLAGAASAQTSERTRTNAMRRSLVFTAALGILAFAWFWTALFWFGGLNADYSQFTKAVSELGTIGAPDATAWNIFGFGLTGVLLALYGWRLAHLALPGERMAAVWLALSGAAFAGTGVFPADMNAWTSATTVLHIVMSFLVVVFWFLGAWYFLGRKDGFSKPFATVTIVCMILTVLAFAARFMPFILPGLAQRISFGAYFLWYLASALLVLRIPPGDAAARTG